MTSHSLSIFCPGRVLSLYWTSHLATQARTPSLTIPFWTTSKYCQGMYSLKIYQASWSISIELDAQCVSNFTEVFLWKNSFKHSLCFPENSTSFPIKNMSFTYTYQKCYSAPTHFHVNTRFIASLYKNYMLWSTHQSVYSNSEMLAPVHRWIAGALHTLWAPLGSTRPSGCIIYNSSLRNPLRNAVLTSICQIS